MTIPGAPILLLSEDPSRLPALCPAEEGLLQKMTSDSHGEAAERDAENGPRIWQVLGRLTGVLVRCWPHSFTIVRSSSLFSSVLSIARPRL
jgi:hypothetical protein